MSRLAALVVPGVLGLAGMAGVASATVPPAETVFAFTDPEITESSGLVALESGLVVTVNDSGDAGRVFVVDPASGDTVGVRTWGEAVDVEALAPLPARAGAGEEVLVGDIGDNRGVRDSVELLRVPVGRGEEQVTPTRWELVYPQGPRDAEALLVHPTTEQVVVVTKGVLGGEVLLAPPGLLATDGTAPGEPVRLRAAGLAMGVVTDGAFLPDGEHLVLRDYSRAVLYTWPDLDVAARLALPPQPQGEGLAVEPGGETMLLSTEGVFTDALRVALPEVVAAPPTPPSAPAPAPDRPAAEPEAAERGVLHVVLTGGVVLAAVAAGGWLLARRARWSRPRR